MHACTHHTIHLGTSSGSNTPAFPSTPPPCAFAPPRGSFNVYSVGEAGPVVFCIHGGGYTGLTWSLVAEKLKGSYRVVAPDLRGHGLTSTQDDLDFSKEVRSRAMRACETLDLTRYAMFESRSPTCTLIP
jgi:pimeloyl-ACP methyl ester carboxylesterase